MDQNKFHKIAYHTYFPIENNRLSHRGVFKEEEDR